MCAINASEALHHPLFCLKFSNVLSHFISIPRQFDNYRIQYISDRFSTWFMTFDAVQTAMPN